MVKESNISGYGKMSVQGMLETWSKDPEFGEILVGGFTRSVQTKLPSWHEDLAHPVQDIKRSYQHDANVLSNKGKETVLNQQASNKEQVQTSAEQKGLIKENFVDTSARDLAEAKIKSNKQEIQHAKDQLNNNEIMKQKMDVLKEEQKLIRDNNTINDSLPSHRNKIKENIRDKIDNNN